jgi:hypothetical protein
MRRGRAGAGRGKPRPYKNVVQKLNAGSLLFAVGEDFSAVDYRDVTTALQELHYFFAFGCELRPAGLGFGVLFEGAERFALELEIDLGEIAFGGSADRIRIAVNDDTLRRLDERLLPDGEDARLEFGRP